ncbi:MAG: hypothetical protein COB09_17085 [Thalassobium sp.]|nr:MAG: hypothetical protein COB09_17085 [Thalassobium sp.]
MDDFQNEPQDIVEDVVTESAPVEAEQPEGDAPVEQEAKVTFDEPQQAKVNELIGQKVGAQRAAERRAEDLQRQLTEMQGKLPEDKAPELPPLPNPDEHFDDPAKYKAQVEAREAAIIKRAEFNAGQQAHEAQIQQETYRKQVENQEVQKQRVTKYEGSAKSFGIEEAAMNDSANILARDGISEGLFYHILDDAHGPLITAHLANDPVERDKVFRMSLAQAAVYIHSEVKPKLTGTRKTTTAPKPVSIVSGSGIPDKEPDINKRAVYK